jgi:hypothetical protein
MNLRSDVTKKLEATVVVVVSTVLAIVGADHFERSGPDRELLRQLKEMKEARQECSDNVEVCPPRHHRWNAPPPHLTHRYAER